MMYVGKHFYAVPHPAKIRTYTVATNRTVLVLLSIRSMNQI